MRAPRIMLLTAALAMVVAGCGSNGDDGDDVAGPTDAPAAGSSGNPDDLIVLEDDKNLQTVDNIVPIVLKQAAVEPLTSVLDSVSAAMTTEDLIGLNRKADVERQSPARVAQQFAEEQGLDESDETGTGSLVIGAANFSESQILANLYAIALEAAGYSVEVKNVTNREVYGPALERGELTVFPEYVGTFTEYLNKRKNGENAEALASGDLDATMDQLRTLADEVGLVALEPSPAADQNAFAVTRAFAEENDLRTLSDLAGIDGLTLGGPPECPTRPFCQPGLEEVYGIEFDGFVSLDAGGPLTKAALQQGRIQVGLVFSSDGSLSTLDE
jgi:osmoprotectant transport system substrate-binding protein